MIKSIWLRDNKKICVVELSCVLNGRGRMDNTT
jgi:hypothetical protein